MVFRHCLASQLWDYCRSRGRNRNPQAQKLLSQTATKLRHRPAKRAEEKTERHRLLLLVLCILEHPVGAVALVWWFLLWMVQCYHSHIYSQINTVLWESFPPGVLQHSVGSREAACLTVQWFLESRWKHLKDFSPHLPLSSGMAGNYAHWA